MLSFDHSGLRATDGEIVARNEATSTGRLNQTMSLLPFFQSLRGTFVCVSAGSVRVIVNATSLGGVTSLIESRHRWEGDRVPPGLLRLSVGLEDPEDLWADLTTALEAA